LPADVDVTLTGVRSMEEGSWRMATQSQESGRRTTDCYPPERRGHTHTSIFARL